jgi:16S rRNA (cytosine1402-N4)-methyltransferase
MHDPVMVEETTRVLITDPNGTYLDLNLGYAGHAEAICRTLGPGAFRYIGVDLDPIALAAAKRRLAPFGDRVTLLRGDHRTFPALLASIGVERVDGILFDLGFSSAQLDPERGFAFDTDGPLDMRYGREGRTAADLLAAMPEAELADAFRRYGDLRPARKLAAAIVSRRMDGPIETTGALAAIVDVSLRPHPARRRKVLSQVFQTIRVLVNDEVRAFGEALEATPAHIRPGGVVCVLAYESVTDRMVKRFFRPTDVPRDVFGNEIEPRDFEPITRRAVRAGDDEIARNPSARSARLRAARRVGRAA